MSTPMPPRRSRRELREEAEQSQQFIPDAVQEPEAVPEPAADSQPILVRSRRRRRAEDGGEPGAAPTADPQPQAQKLEPSPEPEVAAGFEVAPAAPIRVSRRAHRLAEAQAELSSAASLASATSGFSATSGLSAVSAPSAAGVSDFDTPVVEEPAVQVRAVDVPAVEPASFDVPSVVSTPSVISATSAAEPDPVPQPQVALRWDDDSFPVTSFADFQQGADNPEPAATPQAPPAPVSGWSTFAAGEHASFDSPQSFESPTSFDSEDLGQPSWAVVSPTQVPGMVSAASSPSIEPVAPSVESAPSAPDLDPVPQEAARTPQIGFGVLPDIPANPDVVSWNSMAAGITEDAPGEFHAAEVALAAQERDTSDDTTDGDRSDLPTYSWLQLAILAGAAVILAVIVFLVLESRNTEESPESMPQDGISQTIDLENTSVIN